MVRALKLLHTPSPGRVAGSQRGPSSGVLPLPVLSQGPQPAHGSQETRVHTHGWVAVPTSPLPPAGILRDSKVRRKPWGQSVQSAWGLWMTEPAAWTALCRHGAEEFLSTLSVPSVRSHSWGTGTMRRRAWPTARLTTTSYSDSLLGPQLFGDVCYNCSHVIEGDVVSALNKAWCVSCFSCSTCNSKLTLKNKFVEFDMKPVCKRCYEKFPLELKKRLKKLSELTSRKAQPKATDLNSA
ncbi:LIM and senescent cell antigen-like-containing domain protein 2 isoform X8 [Homo sapiens]|uniref:LIM and senescent cell antigen-like-containing domain protein 2 isoform X8 n=1 Tax=Homo sapiens TaxID=9606 RepID=UPI0007DC5191|nr:LIM and senescent cell antigen-like-containing domain protein 2 isoform X8 [Homo sapiens]XP_054198876.1 LIM and senescent cell antigen-like-containing domain protein 2 isoform X8 [Homo sapiens]|eukprot:XP_016859958.1 LIM and senescent cell antigen-like-containing domain protein 2 isoform X4 [Homo sapiens]